LTGAPCFWLAKIRLMIGPGGLLLVLFSNYLQSLLVGIWKEKW
jgi:hypothetical protein